MSKTTLFVHRIEKVRLNRKDGIAKVAGTVFCVAGASVITLYKGPTIYSPTKPLQTMMMSTALPSMSMSSFTTSAMSVLGDAKGKSWTLGCLYLIGHCLSWSAWLVLQAPVLKKYPARLSVTSYTCFFGLIQFIIIAAIFERDAQAWIFHSGGEAFSILYAVSNIIKLNQKKFYFDIKINATRFSTKIALIFNVFLSLRLEDLDFTEIFCSLFVSFS